MKVRDTVTGEEYDTVDAPLDTPNAEISEEDLAGGRAPEYLVEVVNPAGETVTMSVVEGTQLIQGEEGLVILPPLDAPNQFEEVTE